MKIRQGFVSNSSSSSFIALGFSIEPTSESYKKLLIATGTSEEEVDKALKEDIESAEKRGWKPDPYEALHEFIWNLGRDQHIRFLQGSEDGVDKDDNVIVLMLEETDDYNGGCFSRGEIICDDSDADYCIISELRESLDTDAPIRILYGTRCC